MEGKICVVVLEKVGHKENTRNEQHRKEKKGTMNSELKKEKSGTRSG